MNTGSMEEINLSPVETSRDIDREHKEKFCPHYERSSCLLHFPCCKHDTFFPCHKCHNERIGCISDLCQLIIVKDESTMDQQDEGNKEENERRIQHHPQAKCSDADTLRCTKCLEQQVVSPTCTNCHKDFAAYFCEKCKIFVNNMEMDPYHCDGCGICRANKSNHQHCSKCNLCLDKQLYKDHRCMEDSGHDMCAVCLETVFSGCCFLPCSHKLHQECARNLIQSGSLDCPICRTSITDKKEVGKCEIISNFIKSKGKTFLRLLNIIE